MKKINKLFFLLLLISYSVLGVNAKEKSLKYTDSNINDKVDQGDKICLGDECFFVVYTDDNNTYALAQYNLLVGNKSNAVLVNDLISYDVNPLDKETNIQSKSAIGGIANIEGTFYGTLRFDEATLENYINNYTKYLKENSGIDVSGRIPDANDAHYLDCDISDTCENTPSWAKSTTYWLSFDSFIISRDPNFSRPILKQKATVDGLVGLRPLISISNEDIEKYGINTELENPETLDTINTKFILLTIGLIGLINFIIIKKKISQ